MIQEPKFANTLVTSEFYEKTFRHAKSTYDINGIKSGIVILNSRDRASYSEKPSIIRAHDLQHKNPFKTQLDYIHCTNCPRIQPRMNTIDWLRQGYKIKFT